MNNRTQLEWDTYIYFASLSGSDREAESELEIILAESANEVSFDG